jgi:peroxiredoxin Q/BCP
MIPNNPIKVGDLLPAFALLDQNNQRVHSSDFIGRPLVIFFYPKDHTPGCTAQACDFRNYESDFQAVGAQVIGINDASVESHKGFADKYSLNYPYTQRSWTQGEKVFWCSWFIVQHGGEQNHVCDRRKPPCSLYL